MLERKTTEEEMAKIWKVATLIFKRNLSPGSSISRSSVMSRLKVSKSFFLSFCWCRFYSISMILSVVSTDFLTLIKQIESLVIFLYHYIALLALIFITNFNLFIWFIVDLKSVNLLINYLLNKKGKMFLQMALCFRLNFNLKKNYLEKQNF